MCLSTNRCGFIKGIDLFIFLAKLQENFSLSVYSSLFLCLSVCVWECEWMKQESTTHNHYHSCRHTQQPKFICVHDNTQAINCCCVWLLGQYIKINRKEKRQTAWCSVLACWCSWSLCRKKKQIEKIASTADFLFFPTFFSFFCITFFCLCYPFIELYT